jgi:hypothetical protein
MPFMQRAWFADHSPGVGLQISSGSPPPPPPPPPVDTAYSVAVGGLESLSTASYTTDGVTWASNTIASGVWVSVAWNGTVFCAVGAELGFLGGGGKIATSPNGITWTVRTGPVVPGEGWTKIRYNGTIFCAISYPGNVSATSPDGITWTPGTPPTVFDPVIGSSLGYCLEWSGSFWCALGTSGFANTPTGWATSTDGLTWTVGSTGIGLPANLGTGAIWSWLAWNGSKFCAIAGRQDTTHISATSVDGQTWVEHDFPLTTTWRSIAWNGTIFCAVGGDIIEGQQVATSADGVTWVSRTSPWLGTIDAVIFDGQYLLLTFNNHNSWLSADGITWYIGTDYSSGLLASNDFAHR